MSIIHMTKATISGYHERADDIGWEYERETVLPGNSDPVLIPTTVQTISVTVSFTSGASGKIQTTTDNISIVEAGSAIFVDWPDGEVSVTTQKSAYPVTAIKIVMVLPGIMKTTIRAQ